MKKYFIGLKQFINQFIEFNLYNKKFVSKRKLLIKIINDFVFEKYNLFVKESINKCKEYSEAELKDYFIRYLVNEKSDLERLINNQNLEKNLNYQLIKILNVKQNKFFKKLIMEIIMVNGINFIKINLSNDLKMIFGFQNSFYLNNFDIKLQTKIYNFKLFIHKIRICIRNIFKPQLKKVNNFKPQKELNAHILNESVTTSKINSKNCIFTLCIYNNKLIKNYRSSFFVELNKTFSTSIRYSEEQKDPLLYTALELIRDRNIEYDDSFLNKHYLSKNPINFGEALKLNKSNKYYLLDRQETYYPWIFNRPNKRFINGIFKNEKRSLQLMRFYKIKNLVNNIEIFGYIPSLNSLMQGYILNNGFDYRFVITQGWHRLAVLKAFNIIYPNKFEYIPVRFDQFRIKDYNLIKLKNIEFWPGVRNKIISRKDAEELFRKYFD